MNVKKPIKGFDGYAVDENGQVWSKKQKAKAPDLPDYDISKKSTLSKFGYYRVGLLRDGKICQRANHRLMALAFIPNPDNLPFACHKDGDSTNNHVSNLYWGTALQNQKDRFKHGTRNLGARNGLNKITEKQVRVIKWAIHYGAAYKHLAKMVGVNTSNISHIASGRSWSHVKI